MTGDQELEKNKDGDTVMQEDTGYESTAHIVKSIAIEKVYVHPLVLLSVVDHYNRVAKDTKKRSVGILLGERRKGGVIEATNSFAVPFEEDEKNTSIWFLDHSYLENMYRMFKKVNAREKIIGWYHTGPRLRESDMDIHTLVSEYCESLGNQAVLVICEVKPKDVGLPVHAYKAVEDVSDTKGATSAHMTQSKPVFLNLPTEVGATEAEEIGVEHLLRDVKDATVSSLSSEVGEMVTGLKGLRIRLMEIKGYLDAVVAGKMPVNNDIIKNLQDIFSLLPNLNMEHVVSSFAMETNDMMISVYVASLVRSVVSLHSLIENKELQGHVHGSSQVTWYPEYPGESASSIEICNGGFGFSVIRSNNGLVVLVGHGFQSPLPGIGSVEPVVGVAIGFDQIYYVKLIDDIECEIYRVTVTSPESICAPHVRTTAPLHVRTLPRIKSIAAGESHCAMVTHDGRVFQYGEKSSGEEVDIGCTVVHVCCGSHHTVALSKDGQVWTWGDSLRGQCGRGIRESAPGVVDFGPVKMRHIAAGSSFTLSCSDTGDVYSWGTNAEGALGQSFEGVSSAYEPMLVDFFGVDGRDVVKLAAGSSHALALTANGVVYGFGSNRFGQLGVGQHVTKTHTPIQIGLQKTCHDVAAGWWHSVFVTEA